MPDNSKHLVQSAISDGRWDLEDFISEITADRLAPLPPFDEASVSFCESLSKALFDMPQVRDDPDILALAYWLRPKQIADMQQAFQSMAHERMILCPVGRVFHIPPANVDTLFVYGWALSLLVGNCNILRIPERLSSVVERLLAVIGRTLAESQYTPLRDRNWIVHTGHNDAISAALSSVADLRVVWGGDETIEHFRQFKLPISGRELVFPDRHSLALISAEAIVSADDDELTKVAGAFFNDAYWFDQATCSSPRLIVWHDPDGTFGSKARARFHQAVAAVLKARGYKTEVSTAIEKMVFSFQAAAEQPIAAYQAECNEATWMELSDLSCYNRSHCGGGVFYEYISRDLLSDLTAIVTRKDQTAGYYGFSAEQIRKIARALNGRGIDRWTPIGNALSFDRIWDGYDLLQEMSRKVTIG